MTPPCYPLDARTPIPVGNSRAWTKSLCPKPSTSEVHPRGGVLNTNITVAKRIGNVAAMPEWHSPESRLFPVRPDIQHQHRTECRFFHDANPVHIIFKEFPVDEDEPCGDRPACARFDSVRLQYERQQDEHRQWQLDRIIDRYPRRSSARFQHHDYGKLEQLA